MNATEREETLFAEAVRLPPEERAAYLAQVTAGDAELRQRVESLLGSYQAGDFLEQAAAPQLRQTLTVLLTEKPGDRIGRYKLLEQIGEGGCGVVYVAEQAEPVRRRVALKIIKLGMDTKSVVARFEAERQALALMDHPNIAKVFDAGSTERPLTPSLSPSGGEGARRAAEGDASLSAGRPYFVMELVRGMKITEYCDEAKLPTNARLDLFIQVCQAIQHAHQKGIIHRDIKPSNILVTVNDGVQVHKVIDFGIAKATSGHAAIRDGRSAVGFAEKAVEKTGRKNAGYLDTLAAAYAEMGEFAKAVEIQKEAIALLRDGKTKKDFESRLKLFQANSPYREP